VITMFYAVIFSPVLLVGWKVARDVSTAIKSCS